MSNDWEPPRTALQQIRGRGAGTLEEAAQSYDMTNRLRAVTTLSPWLARNQDAALAVARMDLTPDQLVDNASALGGMALADSFQQQLKGMTPGTQRAVWSGLTAEQQAALTQQGYMAPERPEDSWLDDVLGGAGRVIGGAFNVVQNVVPGARPLFKGLAWVGDQPAHLYRAIRLGDDESQQFALGGAIIGGVAGAAAIPTGGGSLAALGLIGGGALLGGTAGSIIGSNPSDWYRAFNSSWNGERTFDLPSQRRADEILGDTRLVSLAHDFAAAGVSLRAVATDFAEVGGVGQEEQITSIIAPLAERVAMRGTPEFEKAYSDLISLTQQPAFRDAVNTLVRGKISIGRDTADVLGLDPDSTAYTLVSGLTDGVFAVAVDPTLMLGGAVKWNKARRQGMAFMEGSEGAAGFLRIQDNVGRVRRQHELIARSVADGNFQMARQLTPAWKELYLPLVEYRDVLVKEGRLASRADFGLKEFNEFITGSEHLVPLLRGVGTVKGAKGMVLAGSTRTGSAMRRIGRTMRAFTDGLADPKMETRLLEALDEVPAAERMAAGLDQRVPADLFGLVDEETGFIGAPWLDSYSDTPWSYMAGRAIGHIPGASFVGNSLTAITTMIPARRAMSMDSAAEIHDFAETLRAAGMPAWARRRWEQTILDMPNPMARRKAVIGALDNAMTISGAKATPRGEALVKKYILHEQQAYALGGADSILLPGGARMTNGVLPGHMSLEIVMPDLNELRKATATGWMAEFLQLADRYAAAPVLKVWKPAVILRVGFIPRAAGEEMANFMTRGGLGGIVQGWTARAIGRHEAWKIADERNKLGLALDSVQARLIAEGPLEGHVASMARMMDRTRWESPTNVWVDKYLGWARREVDADAPFRALAGGELATAGDATLLGAVRGQAPVGRTARVNVASNLNALMLGNPLSWRRMVLGGVNDELVEAATQMYTYHGQSLLQAVTSRNAGPLDRGHDPDHAEQMSIQNDQGEWEDVTLETSLGEHDVIAKGEDRWTHGMHESAAEVIHDNVLKDVWAEFLPRITGGSGIRLGGKGGKADAAKLGHAKAVYASLDSTEARMIVDEFLGAPREDSFRSMLVDLERVNPTLASHLRRNVPGTGTPDFVDIRDAARSYARAHPDDTAALAIADELNGAQNLVDDLDKMPIGRRRFMGAHLKARLSADIPLYRSFDDAYDDMLDAVKAKLADAREQGRTMKALGDPELRAGQVIVYAPPKLTTRIADGAEPTFDDLVAVSNNRNVLYTHRATVEALLEHDLGSPSEWMSLVASRELADELTETGARWAGYEPDPTELRMVHFGEDILRQPGVATRDMMAPIAGRGDELAAWSVNRDVIAENRLLPISRELDDSVDRYAEQIMGRARQVMTRDVVQQYRPRMRKKADGTAEPVVFRNVGKGVEPLTDADRLTEGRFVTDKGTPTDVTDSRYFERFDVDHDGPGQVPWELIGPMLEDVFDDLHGASRWVPKQSVVLQKGEMIPSGEQVRIFRSRVEHVNDAGPGLANAVIVPRRTIRHPTKGLERGVELAFDKGIGPAIDALARRPMALHFFNERYQHAKRMQSWVVSDAITAGMDDIIQTAVHAAYDVADTGRLAGHVRSMAVIDGERHAAQWSDAQSLAWLRSHDADQITELVARVENLAGKRKYRGTPEGRDARAAAKFVAGRDFDWLRHALPGDVTPEDFVAFARATLPIGALESRARLGHADVQTAIAANPVLRTVTDEQWNSILGAEKAYATIRESATTWAAEGAIADMMPFIDSHKLKTQFADKGKSLMPFWYAEENFMKRWGRTVLLDPTAVRKAQLGYMGLKNTGIVRSENGRDFIVIPGSGVLTEALSDLPAVGTLFQMPTDRMLPGINSRFGAASFSPVVTVPLDAATALFPELQPIENAFAGDFANIPAYEQLVPGVLTNAYTALTADQTNERYMTMWVNVAAQSMAQGDGPEEDWTPLEVEKWLSRMNDHTRIAMVAGAAMGLFTPAVPKALIAGETASFLGLGAQNPKQVFSSLFYDLIADLGIEQGTIEFNRLYPDAGLEGIVNPEALTTGATVSTTGAVLPATAQAAAFIRDNEDYFSEFPEAAPWLMPVDDAAAASYTGLDAYDAATISAMRRQRTPDEFIKAVMYKRGATDYFDSRELYLTEVEKANAAGDRDRKKFLDERWAQYSTLYKQTHPVFAEELVNGDAQQRRIKVIAQMRVIVDDPDAPKPPHFAVIKNVMDSWDLYQTSLTYARDDRSARGRDRVDFLKGRWSDYMTEQVRLHPEIGSFWTSVLRPESDLT